MDKKQPCSGKVGGGGNQGVGFKRYLVAQINKAMGALQLRKEITSKLAKVDMTVLRAIDAMLDVYTKDIDNCQLYEPDGTPVDMDSFGKQLQDSIEEADAGNIVTQSELNKTVETWLSQE